MKKENYNIVEKKEEPLKFMYPFCLFIFSKTNKMLGRKEKKSQEKLLY